MPKIMDVPDANSLILSLGQLVSRSMKLIVIFSNGKNVFNAPLESMPFRNTNSLLITPHAVSF